MLAHLKKRAVSAFCAALLLSACASAPAPRDDVGAAPALFVARDADSTIYLYGTIHMRRAGEPWGGPHVEAALNEAEEVWTEVDLSPQSQAAAQASAVQLGMSPDRPLSSWLEPEDAARLASLGAQLGLPLSVLEPMRPWLASLTLAIVPIMRAGYDPQAGVDRAIVAWATANERTLRAFETADEQIGFFANMSEDTQRQMLRYTIQEAENGPAVVDALADAWERGDLAALEQAIVTELRDDYPEAYDAIIVRRNQAWVETLMQELAGEGVDFVAVGAGHLVGDESVVALLRARGVHVERVR